MDKKNQEGHDSKKMKSPFQNLGYHLFIYRSYYLSFIYISILFFELKNYYYIRNDLTIFIGLSISIIGFLFRCFTIGYVYNNTSGRSTYQGMAAEKLNIYGSYSMTRNPLYFSNILIVSGIFFANAFSYITVIVLIVQFLYYYIIIHSEEQFLENKFGYDYTDWSININKFIPRISNYCYNDLQFSIKNIVLREYSTFYMVILAQGLILSNYCHFLIDINSINYFLLFLFISLYLFTRLTIIYFYEY